MNDFLKHVSGDTNGDTQVIVLPYCLLCKAVCEPQLLDSKGADCGVCFLCRKANWEAR
jgi:hypothetical protein